MNRAGFSQLDGPDGRLLRGHRRELDALDERDAASATPVHQLRWTATIAA
jgi:hypothetical protein